MPSINEHIQVKEFENEWVKANINLLFTANWLHNKITAKLKHFRVSHEQFNVLRILKGKHPEPMCQKDILSRMIAPQSNLTTLLRKLKDKQLIHISQSQIDKREHVIIISDDGLLLLQAINKAMEDYQNDINGLSISEAFHLNALLDKLRKE